MYKLITPNCPDGFRFDSIVNLLCFVWQSHKDSFCEFLMCLKVSKIGYLK